MLFHQIRMGPSSTHSTLGASQGFVYRDLSERLIIVIVIVCVLEPSYLSPGAWIALRALLLFIQHCLWKLREGLIDSRLHGKNTRYMGSQEERCSGESW